MGWLRDCPPGIGGTLVAGRTTVGAEKSPAEGRAKRTGAAGGDCRRTNPGSCRQSQSTRTAATPDTASPGTGREPSPVIIEFGFEAPMPRVVGRGIRDALRFPCRLLSATNLPPKQGQETSKDLRPVAVSPYSVTVRETGLEPARYCYH